MMSNQSEHFLTPQELRQVLLAEIEAGKQLLAQLSDEELEVIVGGISDEELEAIVGGGGVSDGAKGPSNSDTKLQSEQ